MHVQYLTSLLVLFIAPAIQCAAAATTQPATDPATVKKIPLKEFESMRGKDDAVVLDVRTPKEFAAGHVPGAVNIDWHARDFAEQVGKLDKSKKYLVHCLGGVRSAAATKKMATLGFDQLFDYSAGWLEYSKAGKEVEKGSAHILRQSCKPCRIEQIAAFSTDSAVFPFRSLRGTKRSPAWAVGCASMYGQTRGEVTGRISATLGGLLRPNGGGWPLGECNF